MKTLRIDRNKLVQAILNRSHVGAIPDQWPWRVAVNHDDAKPEARVIWADTPSSEGGYFANFVGEDNYQPEQFVDPVSDYRWGEDEDEPQDPGPEEAARDWIIENLLDRVTLDNHTYKIKYEL